MKNTSKVLSNRADIFPLSAGVEDDEKFFLLIPNKLQELIVIRVVRLFVINSTSKIAQSFYPKQ